MLRRFELLVNEVREATDTTDVNSVRVYEIMRYFNDAQKQIQKIIFTANPSADIFTKQQLYTASRTQINYALPDDIYAYSAINSLMAIKDSRIAQTLTRVAYREKETLWGYALLDKEFILTTRPEVSTISQLLLNYTYKLPTIGYRLAQASADASGQIVAIDSSSLIEDDSFADKYDRYSVVDRDGVIKASQLYLTSNTSSQFVFEGDITAVQNGDYIVAGEFGTSHSCLPTECEPYLMTYVQRRILAKIASTEINLESVFTAEERADIEDLFKDNVKDPLYPVSTDTDYLGM